MLTQAKIEEIEHEVEESSSIVDNALKKRVNTFPILTISQAQTSVQQPSTFVENSIPVEQPHSVETDANIEVTNKGQGQGHTSLNQDTQSGQQPKIAKPRLL